MTTPNWTPDTGGSTRRPGVESFTPDSIKRAHGEPGGGKWEWNKANWKAQTEAYKDSVKQMMEAQRELKRDAALSAWQAGYEACFNDGQRKLWERMKGDLISAYEKNGDYEDWQPFMERWQRAANALAGF